MRPAGLDDIDDCVIGFWDESGGFLFPTKRINTLKVRRYLQQQFS